MNSTKKKNKTKKTRANTKLDIPSETRKDSSLSFMYINEENTLTLIKTKMTR